MNGPKILGSDHHTLWVGTQDWSQVNRDTLVPIGGLLIGLPNQSGADILTKIHTGLVNVEVHYHTSHPEIDLDAWEDVDLVVINSPLGDLSILPLGGLGDYFDEVTPGPGIYAVCCSARGRDQADIDEEADPPVEFYRFDVWPAAPEDRNAPLKQTSSWGREALATFR